MRVLMLLTVLFALGYTAFVLGRRWEGYCIRNAILKNGVAVTQWGDKAKAKIIGTVEEI